MFKCSLMISGIALSILAGCSTPQTSDTTTSSNVSPGMVNSTCPMSGKPLNDGCKTSDWNGDTVGFCGSGCKANFDSKSDADKDAQVAEMKNAG